MAATDDKGDMRTRAIAELALAVETGGDVEQAVQARYMAGVEPYRIAELGGLPMHRVLEIPGHHETGGLQQLRRRSNARRAAESGDRSRPQSGMSARFVQAVGGAPAGPG